MDSRRQGLQETLIGLQQSGEPLIAFSNNQYKTSSYTDNLGGYFFIPKLANWLNISIDSAIDIFYGGLIIIAFIISCIWLYKSVKASKLLLYPVIILVAISVIAFVIGDVYTASFFSVFFLIPIFFLSLSNKQLWKKIVLFVLIGILIGFSNFIRSQAGTVVLVFFFSYLILNKEIRILNKIYLSVSLLIGLTIFNFWHDDVISKRNRFLISQGTNIEQIDRHPLWHSVYIGLGYLDNDLGIKYLDEIASEKVASIKSNVVYCSEEYENILKDEFYKIVKKQPIFFIQTMMAKTGMILLLFLIFSNVGLYFIIKSIKDFRTLIPFVLSLVFSAIPAILVMPRFSYLIGFLSLTVFISIFYYLKSLKRSFSIS